MPEGAAPWPLRYRANSIQAKGEQGLPRSRRIRYSSEYQRVWRTAEHYHTVHFIVLVNPARDISRLGLTVSRKVGNAVCRNRLKRWIRELFRVSQQQFCKAADISIVAKRQAGRVSHLQLNREILSVFARLETDHHD